MKNIVSVREPKFKPLPGELTPAQIREAVLPVKVEALRNALMKCQELPELLHYKKEIDGLAAAVRTIKHEVPEMARQMNRLAKEALFRMGELLFAYDNKCSTGVKTTLFTPDEITKIRARLAAGESAYAIAKELNVLASNIYHIKKRAKYGINKGPAQSERSKIRDQLGITRNMASNVVKLAVAPKNIIESILDNDAIPAHAHLMAELAPNVRPTRRLRMGDAALAIFYGKVRGQSTGAGLRGVIGNLRSVDLARIAELTSEEKAKARKLIVECQEILDAMMQRLEL